MPRPSSTGCTAMWSGVSPQAPPGLCPVDLAKSFLDLCHAQTCGKCVPCRIGLGQLSELMEQVLEGEATMETISIIERVARVIVNSADCAIGRDAARLVLDGVQGFRDDYEEHILRHRCLGGMARARSLCGAVPCGRGYPGLSRAHQVRPLRRCRAPDPQG